MGVSAGIGVPATRGNDRILGSGPVGGEIRSFARNMPITCSDHPGLSLPIAYRYESASAPLMVRCPAMRFSLWNPARSRTFQDFSFRVSTVAQILRRPRSSNPSRTTSLSASVA